MKKIILLMTLLFIVMQGKAQFLILEKLIGFGNPEVAGVSSNGKYVFATVNSGKSFVWTSNPDNLLTPKLDTLCIIKGVSTNGIYVGRVKDTNLSKGTTYNGAFNKGGIWDTVGQADQTYTSGNTASDILTISGDGKYAAGLVYVTNDLNKATIPVKWNISSNLGVTYDKMAVTADADTAKGGSVLSLSYDGSIAVGLMYFNKSNAERRPVIWKKNSLLDVIRPQASDFGFSQLSGFSSPNNFHFVDKNGRYVVGCMSANDGSGTFYNGMYRYDLVKEELKLISNNDIPASDTYTVSGVTVDGNIFFSAGGIVYYYSDASGFEVFDEYIKKFDITKPNDISNIALKGVSSGGRTLVGTGQQGSDKVNWVILLPDLYVVEKYPAMGSSTCGIDSSLIIKLSGDNISINDSSKISISPNPGTIQSYTTNDSLVITHHTFHYGTTYNVVIKTGAIEGQTEDIAWQFTTEAVPEITFTPVENVQGAPVNTAITAAFSKEIVLLDPSKITLEGENGLVSGSASLTGMLITFTPDVALEYSSYYTVIIGAGAIAGISNEISWTFETEVEVNAPVVQNITPVKDAAGVAANAVVSITFDRAITIADTSKITISGITVSGVTVEGSVLTINHPDFANNTEYTVTLALGAVTDLDKTVSWSFTTAENSGIKNAEGKAVAQIYPNPSKGLFHVAVPEKATIKVSDLAGKMQGTYKAEANTIVDLTQSTGIYLIRIEMNGVISTHKVIVE